MRKLFVCVLLLSGCLLAQKAVPAAKPVKDYSGMYTFLQDGEFVQISVEDQGRVTGFISRYGDLDSDKGQFLDHFFKDGKLEGHKLTFTTAIVHGVSFEFQGSIARGAGQSKSEDAYYVLQGTLTKNEIDSNKKTTSKSQEVTLSLSLKTPALNLESKTREKSRCAALGSCRPRSSCRPESSATPAWFRPTRAALPGLSFPASRSDWPQSLQTHDTKPVTPDPL